jgi:hypothetical protein
MFTIIGIFLFHNVLFWLSNSLITTKCKELKIGMQVFVKRFLKIFNQLNYLNDE